MNRRRMMMLQQNSIDYFENHRNSHTTGYKISIEWLNKDTVQVSHNTIGFMGVNYCTASLLSTTPTGSTSMSSVLYGEPIPYLTIGASYKLTLTVVDVLMNDATIDNDGDFTVALGYSSARTEVTKKFSEMVVGTKFEVTRTATSGNPRAVGIKVTNPNLLWDIKFKVNFEEVA